MKKRINNVTYNTDTAEMILDISNGLSYSDFKHIDAKLYRTPKGNFFYAGSGGPMTMFAVSCGYNCTGGSTGIIPVEDCDLIHQLQWWHDDIIDRFFDSKGQRRD